MSNVQYPRSTPPTGYLSSSTAGLLPVSLGNWGDLSSAATADGSELEHNTEINATFLARNRDDLKDELRGIAVFATDHDLKTGAPLYLPQQVKRDVTLAHPSLINGVLKSTFDAIGNNLKALYLTAAPPAGQPFPPFDQLPEQTREVLIEQWKKSAAYARNAGAHPRNSLLKYLFRAEQIADFLKFVGIHTVSDIDNTPHTITVGGLCMHTKSCWFGKGSTLPMSIVGFIVTRVFNETTQTYDGPYQLIPWSSCGKNEYPVIQETQCYDYFGNYDPGDFIPVGRVTMPAKYPASWEMAASYGYASKMADPDPVVALKAISAAPNCQIEINPRLLFV